MSAFVFLASLLAHELAHSIVAVRRGVRVDGITLWLFGGVSRFSSDTSSPGAQALITFVGPLTRLLLGIVFFLASAAVGGGAHPGLVPATLSWLGYINILLGVFNLLPPSLWTEGDSCNRSSGCAPVIAREPPASPPASARSSPSS